VRGLSSGWKDNEIGRRLMQTLAEAKPLTEAEMPPKAPRGAPLGKEGALVADLLKLLLKIRSREIDIAARLLARSDDLEALAAGQRRNLPILEGWRFEQFGRDALDLVEGKLAFAVVGGKLKMAHIDDIGGGSAPNRSRISTERMSTYLPTLKQLQYLVALHEHGHFGRAADACFVSQSTLSAGLRELETLLGVTLVERTRRVVRFTPLGNQVVAKAHRLLREAEELSELVQSHGAPLAGELRMSVIPTIAPFLLPRILPRLRKERPQLRLFLREEPSAAAIDRSTTGAPIACCWPCPSPPAKWKRNTCSTTGSMSPSPRTIRAIRRPAFRPASSMRTACCCWRTGTV
jgi:DNA-binding MarR family transcriptional regulator